MTETNVGVTGLENLHEIVLPTPVSWMPQTGGWYVLFLLMGLVVAAWIFMRVRNFRGNRYRRMALKALDDIAEKLRRPDQRESAMARLSALLKWTALAAFPRTRVAGLSGNLWLAFLDRTLGGNDFEQGEGRLLAELAYAPESRIASLPDDAIGGLLHLCRRWIAAHAPAASSSEKKDMDHASI